MGRKVNANAFRLNENLNWNSRWFARKDRYCKLLIEDVRLRKELMKKLENAGIVNVVIERSINTVKLTLYVARPGVAIGRGGKNLEEIKKFINDIFKKTNKKIKTEIQIEPVGKPNLNAYLVAKSVSEQIERRIPHRRVVYRIIDQVASAGAKGIQIILSGRIAGAEIARTEKYKRGSIPFSTIREDVEYAQVPALTKSGYVGIKVWICRK